ncbi:MAG TPA: tRNA (guanosine(37)-N1)-methyltransferase TrmD [Polyangia bacterium]|nr:tRNA (guanosine(37)-N1)-methyltransferase TrmD [Polyangia bacterium]HVV17731.1 tRNA (guanosine(37)-N1)-methyltransferase TrmD [Polyangia bacterium]
MTTTSEETPGAASLTFEIVTLFPDVMAGFLATTVIGRAITAGVLAVHCTNPRDHGLGRYRQVDDTPFGGGPGMILRVEPVAAALEAVAAARGPSHRILLTPRGRLFDQARARELAGQRRVTLICGRYEGIDERITSMVDEELRIGDFVLAGGEVAAAAIVEAVGRLVPGVLGCGQSPADESFSAGRLEYPQWTRPAVWREQAVPEVLLSGNHRLIDEWRRAEAARATLARRPDLIAAHPLSDEERRLLAQSGGEPPHST